LTEEVYLIVGGTQESLVSRGRERVRNALESGSVSLVLRQVGDWAGYVQEAANALEQVVELARQSLQREASSDGSLQQPVFAADPALFVNLLKTREFQQVMAVLLVQFLRSA
jgi:hypothetical protein